MGGSSGPGFTLPSANQIRRLGPLNTVSQITSLPVSPNQPRPASATRSSRSAGFASNTSAEEKRSSFSSNSAWADMNDFPAHNGLPLQSPPPPVYSPPPLSSKLRGACGYPLNELPMKK